MEKLRITILLDTGFAPTIGGGFSYYDKLINSIDSYKFDSDLEISFTHISNQTLKYSFTKPIYKLKSNTSIKVKFLRIIKFYLSFLPFSTYFISRFSQKISNYQISHYQKELKRNKIDLIYYPTPSVIIPNYPYIVTNWDLAHKTTFAFPEFTLNGAYEKREKHFSQTLNKAFLVIVESEMGKQELIDYYNLSKEKIKVLPLFPSRIVNLTIDKKERNIYLESKKLKTNKFFLYPAQFWSHKNHYNLILAFQKFLKINSDYHLVFTGSDKGNFEYIKQLITKIELTEQIKYLGFVKAEELFCLYKEAKALVMPTFLGPTNMPLLEALHLGCPIVCSNLKGHINLLKDKALYVEPNDVNSILDGLLKVLTFETPNIDFSHEPKIDLLNKYFLTLKPIRKTFGINFQSPNKP